MKRLWACGVMAAIGLALACATVQALEIPITVEEPAGIARTAEPVSGGIPLPWGQFKKDQPFALFDGANEVPLQALPLVVDEKGFLRWILLDFQTDLGAKQKKTFTLKAVAGSARPANALKVTNNAGGVTVDTGTVALVIARDKPFGLFDSVAVNGRKVASGGKASYTDDFDGKRYVADKPSSVVVEYEGPMRATVAVKGRFVGDDDSKLRYIARVTAWAGRSDVHVKYSLANSNPDHYTYRRIKDSTVTLRLAAPPTGVTIGANGALDAAAEAWIHQSMRVVPAAIHSHDVVGNNPWFRRTPGAEGPGGCKAVSAGKDLWTSQGKDDAAEGWIAARSAGSTVWASDLYFVEDPPRRLAVSDGTLALTGITEPLKGTTSPFGGRQRWLFDCTHIASQYVLDFSPIDDASAMSTNAKRVRARVWAMAPPAWYLELDALPAGKYGTQADELACYDQWGWKYDKAKVPTAPAEQTARIARYVAGDDNHFTSEQDTLEALILMYLRTGGRRFFDAAETWANYFVDLQTWRSDDWRWKDGGVWWHGGPAGNRPQRAADPVTGVRNSLPAEWTKEWKTKVATFDRTTALDINFQFLIKSCYCHNWGEGLVDWFCLTGDRDAYEAAIDTVEQQIDFQRRSRGRGPNQPGSYSRDFTRASYLTHAARLVAPTDPFVVEASDFLAQVYLTRTNKEPRGLANAAGRLRLRAPRKPNDAEEWDQAKAEQAALEKWLMPYVGEQGIAEMKRLGVTFDFKTGQFHDPETGAKWQPITGPNTWMFPPLSKAMGVYYRITGNEDAQDWLIAYGQSVAHVLYQPRHGNLSGRMLADFPLKGVAKDQGTWVLPEDSKDGEGVKISGYLARFYPDVPASAYALCGEPFLKQRAYDYWYYGSHRGYGATKLHNVGGVGQWVNTYTTHGESVCFTGRTFYEWAHPRKDEKAPAAVADLKVVVAGERAEVTFTAPADAGGKVVRYQVKCSEKPIVSYEDFLKAFSANTDGAVENWWMAANLKDEPTPGAPGTAERFTVTGVPEGATYFAVRSFDDSSNRSALSNVAQTR